MRAHPFDVVETMTPHDDDPEPRRGNQAYYDWIGGVVTAATRRPVPWAAIDIAIMLDRIIRAHEAEMIGGPKCEECIAREVS